MRRIYKERLQCVWGGEEDNEFQHSRFSFCLEKSRRSLVLSMFKFVDLQKVFDECFVVNTVTQVGGSLQPEKRSLIQMILVHCGGKGSSNNLDRINLMKYCIVDGRGCP